MLIYYKIIFLLGAITAFVVAVFILLEGGKNVANRNFFVVTTLSAIWSFGFYQLAGADNLETAIFWRWFMESGSILLPIWWLKFVYEFLEIVSNKRIIILTYVTGGLVWILNLLDLYIPGIFVVNMESKLVFSNYPTAGFGYYLFSCYFASVIFYSLFLVYRELRRNSGIRARQIKFVLIAAALGFIGGGMTFLPTLNIYISPVGVIFFSVYPAIIAYAILKHHLFSLKLILVELAILLLNMLLLFNVFTSRGQADAILNIFISSLVFLFSIFLMRGIYKDIRDRERIESLAYEMAVVNEKLKIMEEQKTEFVSIASHQLRTPLTVIKGYASMIRERTFGELSAEVQDAMDKLYRSSERIVALVDDLLTVSRLEQGRMPLTFESVELGTFMQSVVDGIEARTTEVGLDISFNIENETESWSSIDEKKFKQVLNHMLDNAIKYTTSPGSIYVTLSEDLIAQKNRIAISDTGEGMTNEQIRAVFERFNLKVKEPLSSDESNKDGAQENALALEAKANEEKIENEKDEEMLDKKTPGIGLYIAQEIIHAHKGTLRVESAGKNRGTTFIVELPREAKKDTERR